MKSMDESQKPWKLKNCPLKKTREYLGPF